MNFRTLRADEIECRVQQIKDNGLSLLLYKDARCDMAMLDESVGAENWQRKHDLINGNLFCSVGIKTADGWVWKQDVGKESNTEAEKGQASDSFKRACVNWGIGRELYTAPFVWIDAVTAEIETKNGKSSTKKHFRVSRIGYDDKRNIISLEIKDEKTGKVVYSYGFSTKYEKEEPKKEEPKPANENDLIDKVMVKALKKKCENGKVDPIKLLDLYNVDAFEKLTLKKHQNILDHWDEVVEHCGD